MKQIIMCRGLPASGKSTYAKALVAQHPDQYKRICKDDLRSMLDSGKHSKGREQFVLAARDALVVATLHAGYSPIIDDTNFAASHETRLRALAEGFPNVQFRIQDFTDVPLAECIARDQQRPNYVGEQVIRRMWQQYLAPVVTKPALLPDTPWAIIVDMDGTLAKFNGRSPYDYDKCDTDLPHVPVVQTVHALLRATPALHLLIMSGREASCREKTVQWLLEQDLAPQRVLMRTIGDHRPDVIIKRELYDAEVQGKYNIQLVLDDRTSIVNLWRSLGLTCFQVADGDF